MHETFELWRRARALSPNGRSHPRNLEILDFVLCQRSGAMKYVHEIDAMAIPEYEGSLSVRPKGVLFVKSHRQRGSYV